MTKLSIKVWPNVSAIPALPSSQNRLALKEVDVLIALMQCRADKSRTRSCSALRSPVYHGRGLMEEVNATLYSAV